MWPAWRQAVMDSMKTPPTIASIALGLASLTTALLTLLLYDRYGRITIEQARWLTVVDDTVAFVRAWLSMEGSIRILAGKSAAGHPLIAIIQMLVAAGKLS